MTPPKTTRRTGSPTSSSRYGSRTRAVRGPTSSTVMPSRRQWGMCSTISPRAAPKSSASANRSGSSLTSHASIANVGRLQRGGVAPRVAAVRAGW